MPASRFVRRRRIVAAAVAAWAAFVVWGWYSLTAYSLKSDDSGTPLATAWPAGSQLPRRTDRPALIAFLHPKCPCSRATATELERMLGRPAGEPAPEFQVLVVAVIPREADDSWIETPLLERCRQLPGAEVVVDRGGAEAALFGATTSGTTFWFDADGRRQFGGGITIARGHEGRSEGGRALASLLRGRAPHVETLPAFGCRLPAPLLRPTSPRDPE